ncbi:YdcF family protein [Listeria sp. PSOL-1]|uniref:YdcF family protein n=1 Tax=Listeria sp. PSOL-1 TaxID=1844999 RepID=UPI0013D48B2B|nr:YdcF family protein [Listeria sp. PSOL-1]
MFLGYIVLIFLAIFVGLSIFDRRRISNGIFLTIGLFFLLLFILGFVLNAANEREWLRIIVIGVFILILLMLPLFIIGIGVGLVANGRLMMKREGRRLANLLPLFLGLLILGLIAWGFALGVIEHIIWLSVPFFFAVMICGYFSFFFLCFLVSMIAYRISFLRKNQDFIIVLGSGLIGDRVPPLLASRLNRAIQFSEKQIQKTGKKATFIVSGGQGANELMSEANAMRLYLLDKGIPEEYIIMEDKSTNTLENMRFSKQKMDSILDKYNSIFATNNFHLFRASLYARKAGLKSHGIGSKTAYYYLPNALLREFIAIVMMYKWVHITLIILMLLPFVLLFFLFYFQY